LRLKICDSNADFDLLSIQDIILCNTTGFQKMAYAADRLGFCNEQVLTGI
jgi:hypothetical protein